MSGKGNHTMCLSCYQGYGQDSGCVCTRKGLEKKFLHRRGCQALEWVAQGSGGATIPGSVQSTYRCGTWGHGLIVNLVMVLDLWLDLMILEVSTFIVLKFCYKLFNIMAKKGFSKLKRFLGAS